jgi:hypothetical protein
MAQEVAEYLTDKYCDPLPELFESFLKSEKEQAEIFAQIMGQVSKQSSNQQLQLELI